MTQNTLKTTTSTSTSHTSQRGTTPPLEDYVKEQYAFNKRDGESPYNRKVVERALRFARVTKASQQLRASSVLDVGCRDGFAIAALESELEGARIVGVDIVPQFVESAKRVGSEVYLMDAHLLNFEDEEFDYVFSSHTLEHCYDHMRALGEMKRVARLGLYLVLPLESHESMVQNHSHYFSTFDPMVWANKVSDDKWMVTGVDPSTFSDVVITAVPRKRIELAFHSAPQKDS